MRNVLAVATSVSTLTAVLVSGCNLKIEGLDGLLGDGTVTVSARHHRQGQAPDAGTSDEWSDEDPCAYSRDPQACYERYYGDGSVDGGGDYYPGDPGQPDDPGLCAFAADVDECFSYPGCAWGDDGYGERCLYIGDPGKGYPDDPGKTGKDDYYSFYPDYDSCLSDPTCAWCDSAYGGSSGCHQVKEDPGYGDESCYAALDAYECEVQGCVWDEEAYFCSPDYDMWPDKPGEPSASPCEKAFDVDTCAKLGCTWDEQAGFCYDGNLAVDGGTGPDAMKP
jgi:hypothetical protein